MRRGECAGVGRPASALALPRSRRFVHRARCGPRMTHEHLHLVVIAGGAGTRFWPLSRRHLPQQLLALAGGAPLGRAHSVARFVEKPSRERAEGFLAQGGFYWNAGIFVMRAARFVEEEKAQLPRQHAALAELARHLGARDYKERLAAAYAA